MGTKNYTITGQVVDQQIQEPLQGLKVQLWDKDVKFSDLLGEAITDDQGKFTIQFDESHFQDHVSDHLPDVFVRIFKDRVLIHSTETSVFDNLPPGTHNFIFEVRIDKKDTVPPVYQSNIIGTAISLSDFQTQTEDILGLMKVSIHALTTANIDFINKEANIPKTHLKYLKLAHTYSREYQGLVKPELFYGMFRQKISTTKKRLLETKTDDLKKAILQAIEKNNIPASIENELSNFHDNWNAILSFNDTGNSRAATDPNDPDNPDNPDIAAEDPLAYLVDILATSSIAIVLQNKFIDLYKTHEGNEDEFWDTAIENDPELKLVKQELEFTIQVSNLVNRHIPMLKELQKRREQGEIAVAIDLVKFNTAEDWLIILDNPQTSVISIPENIEGENSTERKEKYAQALSDTIELVYPTAVLIRHMNTDDDYRDAAVTVFLNQNEDFSLGSQNIEEYFKQDSINTIGISDIENLITELKTLQRLANITPAVKKFDKIKILKEQGYDSAASVAEVPKNTFINAMAAFMARDEGYVIHERSSFIDARNDFAGANINDILNAPTPVIIDGGGSQANIIRIIQGLLPNWRQLFGSIDFCTCSHCRSVYSPAAYLVDILRYLDKATKNGVDGPEQDPLKGESPLQVLLRRRPDLAHLPLTCENTNTAIPYIDLANEIMEFYVVNKGLTNFKGYDTGNISAEELQATPQNTNKEAYRILATETVHPFTFPYHQPQEVINTYLEHLQTDHYEIIKTFYTYNDIASQRALTAKYLNISEEMYTVLIGRDFQGTPYNKELKDYYGIPEIVLFNTSPSKYLTIVSNLLEKTGVTYGDLVDILKTRFINGNPETLSYIENLFKGTSLSAIEIYNKMKSIFESIPVTEHESELTQAIENAGLSREDFEVWVQNNFEAFQSLLTLHEEDNECNIQNTRIRSIKSLYEEVAIEIPETTLFKLHRFIRLLKKLPFSSKELDLILTTFDYSDITSQLIEHLATIQQIRAATKIPLESLLAFWGTINAYGEKTLYKKLFLKRTLLDIDPVFKANALGEFLKGLTGTVLDHLSVIQAAFGLQSDEINNIAIHANIDLETTLDLRKVTILYRYALLAKVLKLSIQELIDIISFTEKNPFSTVWDATTQQFTDIEPKRTFDFITIVQKIKEAPFSIQELTYILTTKESDDTKYISDENLFSILREIREEFTQIEETHPETDHADENILRQKLGLIFEENIVEETVKLIEGTSVYIAKTTVGLAIEIPETLQEKVSYISENGTLQLTGILSEQDLEVLGNIIGIDEAFQTTAITLFYKPFQFMLNTFYSVFESDFLPILEKLYNLNQVDPPYTEIQKYTEFYEGYRPFLKQRLQTEALHRELSKMLVLDEKQTKTLLGMSPNDWKDAFGWQGLTAKGVSNNQTIEYQWNDRDPAPENASWEGWIHIDTNEPITFIVEVKKPEEHVQLWVNDELIVDRTSYNAGLEQGIIGSTIVDLETNSLCPIKLTYQSNGVSDGGVILSWKTPSRPRAVIPTQNFYAKNGVDQLRSRISIWNKASILIRNLDLSHEEIKYFQYNGIDFSRLNFNALQFDAWDRVNSYVNLRKVFANTSNSLIDIFRKVINTNPVPELDEVLKMITNRSGWGFEHVSLVASHFGANLRDFQDEIMMVRMHKAHSLIQKLGVPVNEVLSWAKPNSDFESLDIMAEHVKRTLKIKYDNDSWERISEHLNDQIRESQKQALISHLLTVWEIQNWGVKDANGLYDYFLIDVQMDSCMDTSRIKQAISSVQLFINRCFLNLENWTFRETQVGVQPEYLSRSRWEWMKSYRVWEANRKVFVYPENWIEPELRDDKTPFFKDLESELLQNDITKDTVETALRNYLYKLDEVAKLDICGMYEDEETRISHVFGRTMSKPYTYYYRTHNHKYDHWSAWEPVTVNIDSVEDTETGGVNNGVHLLPVVWKGRLLLFWPIFTEKLISKEIETEESFQNLAAKKVNDQKPDKYWEITLAYTEYRAEKWTPKLELSPVMTVIKNEEYEFLKKSILNANTYQSKDYLFQVVPKNESIRIYMFNNYYNISTTDFAESNYFFQLESIHSDVDHKFSVNSQGDYPSISGTKTKYNKVIEENELKKGDETYLEQGKSLFQIIPPANFSRTKELKGEISLDKNSFFYQDHQKSYFVNPRTVSSRVILYDRDRYGVDFFANRSRSLFNRGSIHDHITGPISFLGGGQSTSITNSSATTKISTTTYFTFQTFYHPYVNNLIQNLNRWGINALMQSDTDEIHFRDDSGDFFKDTYEPTDLVETPYPKENLDLERNGAYSQYNWELFFHAPLYIATQLSKNGKYQEAMEWFHYIFDPTTDEEIDRSSEYPEKRYWKFREFRKKPKTVQEFFNSLQASTDNSSITQWRDTPFKPHLVARDRPGAYMKTTVMKYLDNLIAWADQLFRKDTIGSINEATQLYIIASHILGPKPQQLPKRGKIKAETYESLSQSLDAFSNAKVSLENSFPFSGQVTASSSEGNATILGTSSALYFCIPPNPELLAYWDTVGDRLFKIRHCMNIEGIERQLALFEPPIDPALLVQATSQGLNIGSVLSDINSPLPHYRFTYILQKALEFNNEVRAFGGALLTAIEKRDGEELALLRSHQETGLLEMVKLIRTEQIHEAKTAKESLLKTRENIVGRFIHYQELLGVEEIQRPAIGDVFTQLEVDVDVSLVNTDVTGVKLIPKEQEDIDKSNQANNFRVTAGVIRDAANIAHLFPTVEGEGQPLGVGVGLSFGGINVGSALSAVAGSFDSIASHLSFQATQASKMGSFIRRDQDWTFQANQAGRELKQIDTQITAADIRIAISEQELENHQKQIDNSKEVADYLKMKYSNQELYQWMKGQTFTLYKQSYQLAYEMAKKAEKAYRLELGETNTSFIQYGFWDSSKEGLLSGDKLQLALRKMESNYINNNKRELELTKHISLKLLNANALILLKENGTCEINIPEVLFDLDFPGHYFRRIKSVSITLPCIAGPYTSINAKLTLMNNSIRKNTIAGTGYTYTPDSTGYDPRFNEIQTVHQQIATSSGQNDSGLFELNFRDERYLPFERAGAISTWKLELPNEFRQFDYDTISDVILHMNYTAREGGASFKKIATESIVDNLKTVANELSLSGEGLHRMFSLKQDFPNEYHRFLYPEKDKSNEVTFQLLENHFPYYLKEENKSITEIVAFIKPKTGKIAPADLNGLELTLNQSVQLAFKPSKDIEGLAIANNNEIPLELKSGLIGNWSLLVDKIPDEPTSIEINGIKKLNPEVIDDILITYKYTIL